MDAIIELYGFKEGLTTKSGKITNWVYDVPEPTQEELNQIVADYKAANLYKEQRSKEYPSIEEQLDMLYHGSLISWRAEIKKIKDKYPKPV